MDIKQKALPRIQQYNIAVGADLRQTQIASSVSSSFDTFEQKPFNGFTIFFEQNSSFDDTFDQHQ